MLEVMIIALIIIIGAPIAYAINPKKFIKYMRGED